MVKSMSSSWAEKHSRNESSVIALAPVVGAGDAGAVEEHRNRPAEAGVPVLLGHQAAVGLQPGDVGQLASPLPRTGRPSKNRRRRKVGCSRRKRGDLAGEGDQALVGRRPSRSR